MNQQAHFWAYTLRKPEFKNLSEGEIGCIGLTYMHHMCKIAS